MLNDRIVNLLLITSLMITSTFMGRNIQTPYIAKRAEVQHIQNLDLRNYKINQVEELMKVEFEKRKQIELEEQKKREEIEKQKILQNRIYCKFEVSFYTTSPDEGSGTGIGASGEYVQPWISIALPEDIPFYSTATIEGLGVFTNHDTGSYIQWDYDNEGNLVCRVDVCVESKETAYALGRVYKEGYIDIKVD